MTSLDKDLKEVIEEVVDSPQDRRLIKQILEYESEQLTKSKAADVYTTLDEYVVESLKDR